MLPAHAKVLSPRAKVLPAREVLSAEQAVLQLPSSVPQVRATATRRTPGPACSIYLFGMVAELPKAFTACIHLLLCVFSSSIYVHH